MRFVKILWHNYVDFNVVSRFETCRCFRVLICGWNTFIDDMCGRNTGLRSCVCCCCLRVVGDHHITLSNMNRSSRLLLSNIPRFGCSSVSPLAIAPRIALAQSVRASSTATATPGQTKPTQHSTQYKMYLHVFKWGLILIYLILSYIPLFLLCHARFDPCWTPRLTFIPRPPHWPCSQCGHPSSHVLWWVFAAWRWNSIF